MRTMMNKTKEELLNELWQAAEVNIMFPHAMSDGALFNQLRDSIENAVQQAIRNACTKIVESIYTQEELEDDLGLVKK